LPVTGSDIVEEEMNSFKYDNFMDKERFQSSGSLENKRNFLKHFKNYSNNSNLSDYELKLKLIDSKYADFLKKHIMFSEILQKDN